LLLSCLPKRGVTINDNNITTGARNPAELRGPHESTTPYLTAIVQLTTKKVGSTHRSQSPVFCELPKQEYISREEAPARTKSNLSSFRLQGSRAPAFLGKTGTYVNRPRRLLVNLTQK
jgi:hypothetical protein